MTTALPLQASAGARASASPLHWLCCEAGGQVLAVPALALREIVRGDACSPLPLTPNWVRGLLNLRGSPLPVLDLAARLGLSPGAVGHRSSVLVVASAPQAAAEPVPVAAAETGAEAHAPAEAQAQWAAGLPPLGLWVDRVLEIVTVSPQPGEAVPPFGQAVPSRFVAQVLRRNGQPVCALALEQVLHGRELARAMADHARQACGAAAA
jgi:purine-binding chemotaxis protein CheW